MSSSTGSAKPLGRPTTPVTPRTWNAFLTICLVGLLSACAHEPRHRVYVSDPDRGGAVRMQGDEVIPYAKTKGMIMMTAEELELVAVEFLLSDEGDE